MMGSVVGGNDQSRRWVSLSEGADERGPGVAGTEVTRLRIEAVAGFGKSGPVPVGGRGRVHSRNFGARWNRSTAQGRRACRRRTGQCSRREAQAPSEVSIRHAISVVLGLRSASAIEESPSSSCWRRMIRSAASGSDVKRANNSSIRGRSGRSRPPSNCQAGNHVWLPTALPISLPRLRSRCTAKAYAPSTAPVRPASVSNHRRSPRRARRGADRSARRCDGSGSLWSRRGGEQRIEDLCESRVLLRPNRDLMSERGNGGGGHAYSLRLTG